VTSVLLSPYVPPLLLSPIGSSVRSEDSRVQKEWGLALIEYHSECHVCVPSYPLACVLQRFSLLPLYPRCCELLHLQHSSSFVWCRCWPILLYW
jgi:hypothetical protein